MTSHKEPLSIEELKRGIQLFIEMIESMKNLEDTMAKSYEEGPVPRIKSREEIRNEIAEHFSMTENLGTYMKVDWDATVSLDPTMKKFFEIYLNRKLSAND